MPQCKTVAEALALRLVITEPPTDLDPLGRPLVGPCLIWTGYCDKRQGYGRITSYREFGKSPQLVHRVMYARANGIPLHELGPQLDHLCRVHACASPAHLEVVTNKLNHERGYWATRDRCENGHLYTLENTRLSREGWRKCRQCRRDAYAREVGRPVTPYPASRRIRAASAQR